MTVITAILARSDYQLIKIQWFAKQIPGGSSYSSEGGSFQVGVSIAAILAILEAEDVTASFNVNNQMEKNKDESQIERQSRYL